MRSSDPAVQAQQCFGLQQESSQQLIDSAGPILPRAQRSLISDRDLLFEVNTRNETSDNQRLCSQREKKDTRNPNRSLGEGNLEEYGISGMVQTLVGDLSACFILLQCHQQAGLGRQAQANSEDIAKHQKSKTPIHRFSLVIGVKQFVT